MTAHKSGKSVLITRIIRLEDNVADKFNQ